jgi:hypothetical protein
LKNSSAFICNNWLSLKTVTCFFEMSELTYPATWCHIISSTTMRTSDGWDRSGRWNMHMHL